MRFLVKRIPLNIIEPVLISTELKRNTVDSQTYSPSIAQATYLLRKVNNCGRHRILNIIDLYGEVKRLCLVEQWSPDEISARVRMELDCSVKSYNAIYRAIFRGDFDEPNLSHGHRGKTRHTKNHQERRGKIPISHTIHERPSSANKRFELGHWEADTVAGKTGKACIVSLVDRNSCFVLLGKIDKKLSKSVIDCMITLLESVGPTKCKTNVPDIGKEFSQHHRLIEELYGTKVYFPDPHAPWQ